MVWPADTDLDEIPQAGSEHAKCNQNMCGRVPDPADPASVQFFATWSGTDADGRPMTSSGKSYQAFHLYQNSAVDAFKDWADSGRKLTKKGQACIKDSSKCD